MTSSPISGAPSATWPASPANDLLQVARIAGVRGELGKRGPRPPPIRDGLGVTRTFDTLVMDQRPRLVSVTTRLSLPELGLNVEVRLRELDGRWLAVAEFDGDPEVGIGATPRAALAASLVTLGDRAAAALMADPALFGVSVSLRQPA